MNTKKTKVMVSNKVQNKQITVEKQETRSFVSSTWGRRSPSIMKPLRTFEEEFN